MEFIYIISSKKTAEVKQVTIQASTQFDADVKVRDMAYKKFGNYTVELINQKVSYK